MDTHDELIAWAVGAGLIPADTASIAQSILAQEPDGNLAQCLRGMRGAGSIFDGPVDAAAWPTPGNSIRDNLMAFRRLGADRSHVGM